MSQYTHAALGDLCNVSIGRTPRRSESRYWGGPHPWATIRDLDNGILTRTEQRITDAALDEVMPAPVAPNTLLFSFKLSIGKMAFAGRSMHHNEAIAALPIRNSNILDRDFLFFALKAKTHDDAASHAVLGKVLNKRKVQEIEIPLPPLNKQRRVVGILNRAARIERLRAKAQEKMREFVPALFVTMFGYPARNPMGWRQVPLGDLIQGFQGGKNLRAGSNKSKYRILKVSAVTEGYFKPSMSKPAPDEYVPLDVHIVRPEDLLISRANTSALVGATAVVDHVEANLLLPDKIWRFVWKEKSALEPAYVHALLQTRFMRSQLSAMATGTSGSMKNISQAKLKTLPILVPPIGDQRRFAKLVSFSRRCSRLGDISSRDASALNASLMSRLLEAVA